MQPPGPVRVAIVDLERPLRDLDCTRSNGLPYTRAWIIPRRAGRPLDIVDAPLSGPTLTAGELERMLEAHRAIPLPPQNGSDARSGAGMRTSVIVPTVAQRPEQLRRSLESLRRLDHPDFEVIVVDNRRERAAAPLRLAAGERDPVRVVREPRPGISAARNRGIREATGELIAFTDDDVEVDVRWLRALGARFAGDPGLAAVSGLVLPRELETPAQIWFEQSGVGLDRGFSPLAFERAGGFRVRRRALDTGEARYGSLYATGEFGMGSNMAFRADVLRTGEGFDEALGTGTPACGGEDLAMLVELLWSGRRIAYEPSAYVLHSHRVTLDELERQIYGYGVSLTAMFTAIALRDPRHLVGLASVGPRWLRSLRDPASAKRRHRDPGYPVALARAELRGMLAGPAAYLRSRHMQARWPR